MTIPALWTFKCLVLRCLPDSPCILACLILTRPFHCVFPSDGIHITFPWSVPKFPMQKPAEARQAQRMGGGSWGEVLGRVGTVAD